MILGNVYRNQNTNSNTPTSSHQFGCRKQLLLRLLLRQLINPFTMLWDHCFIGVVTSHSNCATHPYPENSHFSVATHTHKCRQIVEMYTISQSLERLTVKMYATTRSLFFFLFLLVLIMALVSVYLGTWYVVNEIQATDSSKLC